MKVTEVFFCVSLAACGGGGDGSSSSAASGAGTSEAVNQSGAVPASGNPANSDGTTNTESADTGTTPGSSGSSGQTEGDNASAPTAGHAWTVTDLTAVIGENGTPRDINNAGNVVGSIVVYSPPPGSPLGASEKVDSFLYRSGTLTNIGTLGGTYTWANGMNNSGSIVGFSTDSANQTPRGFVYAEDVMQDFSALGGDFNSLLDINDAGQIIGINEAGRAVISSNGVNQDLGTLPGHNRSIPAHINSNGTVLGSSGSFGGSNYRTFLYSDGTMKDLGSVSGCQSSSFNALNNAGQLAGQCDGRLVIRTGENLQELGGISGYDTPVPRAMNNSGQVTGSAQKTGTNTSAESTAFFYDGTQLVDLNTVASIVASGWKIQTPIGLNDAGQILGRGTLNGQATFRFFLLTPVRP